MCVKGALLQIPDPIRASATGSRRTLGLLILVGLFNYMDRQSISILQVPIKNDLHLSDTALGAIVGLSFSMVYTLMAIPIARLADHTSRKLVIALCLGVWSLFTSACSLAVGFWSLALLRMGVAIGEAGCVPASQAIISNAYPLHRRATALATWQIVFPLGTLVGIAASGWLSVFIGWREAFAILGIVGLALVPVILLWLPEPPGAQTAAHPQASTPPFIESMRQLWSSPSFRHITYAGALTVYPLNAALNWSAPYYSRMFGLSMGELSLYLGLLAGGAGAVGVYAGGFIADRLGRRDLRWYGWVPAIASLGAAPLMVTQYLMTDAYLSLIVGIAPIAFMYSVLPAQAAAAQAVVNPRLRALAAGVVVFFAGMIGTALGPFVTGLVSDSLASRFHLGPQSLRYAIASSSLLALLGAWHFFRAAQHLPGEVPARRSGKSTGDLDASSLSESSC